MIALLQRVSWVKLRIGGEMHAETGPGLLAFIGVEKPDTPAVAERLFNKILNYRVFSDTGSRMNLSLNDNAGDLMLVSQFTLAATTDKGLRPGFSSAKEPAEAERIYNHLVDMAVTHFGTSQGTVRSGVFAADMKVQLENDGPVTFIVKVSE
ncbi:MAG: D-aminoacyl-tRNA deacylase [Pseudohongiellaceae bacterium]